MNLEITFGISTCVVGKLEQLLNDYVVDRQHSVRFAEHALNFSLERLFKACSRRSPIYVAGKRESPGPLVAGGQHTGEQAFTVRQPAVAKLEQRLERSVQIVLFFAEAFEGL